jgi:ferredoxin-NADP reductase
VLTESMAAASVTALHVMMAFLRRHRDATRALTSPFVLPSFLFSALPWIWPTPIGLAAGVTVHVIWFVICEVMSPAIARPSVTPLRPSAPTARSARPLAPAKTLPAAPKSAPTAFATASVLAVLDEANEIKTLRLARPEGFEFTPGQFVAVRVQIDGKPHVRCYSISSAPHTRGYLEISVRKQGLVSGTLHATVRAGSSLTINRPTGQFVYPAGDDRPIALIAGGIGITPLLSMLRHAVACDPVRPIVLLYSARTEHDVAFHNELRVLAERYPHIRVAVTLSDAAGETRFRRGRVDASLIRQYVASPAHTIFCLCGPPPMLEAMKTMLKELNVPDAQVRYEQFDTAIAASLVNPAAAAAPRPATSRSNSGAFQVSFTTSGITATAAAGRTLLETAEAEGVSMLSSCRAGVCQACRTRVSSGTVDCRSDVLAPEDREAGFVLPCVSWAASDCELEA